MNQLAVDRREDDVSNSKMSRFITLEFLVSAVVSIFLMGTAYMAIAGEQNAAKKERSETKSKIHQIEIQQQSIKNTVANIQTDTAVIRNEQQHLSKALEKNSKSIEKVLEILMRHDDRNEAP